jgi:uncharacterized protein YidB (DUF937 family)
MGFLDNVLGSAVPGGNYSKPLMIALMALLASGALTRRSSAQAPSAAPSTSPADASHGGLLGGLGGLLDRFRESGHGDVMNSWIGSGENRPIAPNQMGTALGPDIIKTLSQKSGLSEQELLAQLSKILPGVVDKLTPNGRLPTAAEVSQFG